jgi:hypothetical protein
VGYRCRQQGLKGQALAAASESFSASRIEDEQEERRNGGLQFDKIFHFIGFFFSVSPFLLFKSCPKNHRFELSERKLVFFTFIT